MRRAVKYTCEHYRKIMSECRNCDADDAPYKICFLRKRTDKCAVRSKHFMEDL